MIDQDKWLWRRLMAMLMYKLGIKEQVLSYEDMREFSEAFPQDELTVVCEEEVIKIGESHDYKLILQLTSLD